MVIGPIIPPIEFIGVKKILGILICNKNNNIPIIIDWYEIIDFQTKNIKNGYNNIGIPDLIIIQNVLQNNLVLYSIDKHFTFLQKLYKFKLL